MNLSWKDVVVLVVIVLASYWIAFVSGASKFFAKYLRRKRRNVVRGNVYRGGEGPFIKRVQFFVFI